METENTLTTAEESLNELFFEEEARLWAEVYGKQSDKPDLESLQTHVGEYEPFAA